MTKPVIVAKNLSKSYKISHQKEVLKHSALRNFINTIQKPLGGGGPGYTHETFWALKDVSFEIQQGEIFGVVGKNGSGKSTLLKIFSRIVDPTKGSVTMNGKVASLLEVGTGFHPELTGRENIFLNGSMLGMNRSEILRKFNEIVEFSEVERFLDTPVKFYSSGMYVRLAFSVAAHLEPDILILDEVLSVGDAQFQKKSLAKMLSVAKEGKTILFVSHSTTAVEELCTRAMWLNKGEIKDIGPTNKVLDEYIAFTTPEQENKATLSNNPLPGLSGSKGGKSIFLQDGSIERQGNGQIVFEKLEITNTIKSNGKLKIEAWLKNNSRRSYDKTRLSYSILNKKIVKGVISIISNENVNQNINIEPGMNIVTLTINDLNLVAGKYTINSFIARDNTNQEVFDWVQDSAYFIIPDYDYYKVGKHPAYPGDVVNLNYLFEQKGK